MKNIIKIIAAISLSSALLLSVIAFAVNADMGGDFIYTILDDGTVCISLYTGYDTEVRVPTRINGRAVTQIGYRAFRNCSFVMDIKIPDGVTYIGSGAFAGTAWLKTQPNGVVYAGNVCYKYKGTAPKGSAVELREGAVSICSFAFAGCSGITDIFMPDSLISIGDFAFAGCTGLERIILPKSTVSIGSGAFESCANLWSVDIPNGVEKIEYNAFLNCPALTAVKIPKSVTEVSDYSFGYIIDETTGVPVALDNFIMYGYSGSACEKYAEKNGFAFISIGLSVPDEDLTEEPSTSEREPSSTAPDSSAVPDEPTTSEPASEPTAPDKSDLSEYGSTEVSEPSSVSEKPTESESTESPSREQPSDDKTTSSPPHSSDVTLPPHSSDVTLPPHSSDITLSPHSSDTTLPPHSSDTTLPPHNFDLTLWPAENSGVTVDENGKKTVVPEKIPMTDIINLFANKNIVVKTPNGKEPAPDSLIGTGYVVYTLGKDNKEVYAYITIVLMDSNGDGRINSADAREILRSAAKINPLVGAFRTAGDANADGLVNSADARTVLRKTAGLL